jgi:GT2 family glycosyltransferase
MSNALVTLDESGQSENKSQTDESRMTMDLAVLMAAHNRRDTTVLCLQRLFDGRLDNVHLSVTLVDDGSNDGTADAIRLQFPSVAIINGDGTLFWSRAMALAWQSAARSDPDAYLWLNDDVILDPDAIGRAVEYLTSFGGESRAVVVGSCRDPITNCVTYGGQKRVGTRHFLDLSIIKPDADAVLDADTMNGNFVLVSREVWKMVGEIDGRYSHSMGDTDYGFRLREHGIPIRVLNGTVGTCSRDSRPLLALRFGTPKNGILLRDRLIIAKRFGGPLAMPRACLSSIKYAILVITAAVLRRAGSKPFR